MYIHRSALATLIITGITACERAPTPIAPPRAPDIASLVTDEVAHTLTAEGKFVLASPRAPDGTSIISEQRARELAAAYIRTFGAWNLAAWERQRGAKISLSGLSVGPRVYFAQTPYEGVPGGLFPSVKKHYGPYYVMPLIENGIPAVLLAVSAYNTDMTISANGQLILPRLDGNSFQDSGIPIALSWRAAISPEEAVTLAARTANRKVALVPELVLPGASVLPVFALWKVTLDELATVTRGGAAPERVREIFVGRVNAQDTRVPDHRRSVEESGRGLTVDKDGRVGPEATFRVTARPGYATKYEVVTLTPEEL